MQYGSPFMKTKVLPLVEPQNWNGMLELNRMAFDDYCLNILKVDVLQLVLN